MALSNPRSFFGVHSVSPYSRATGEFYGILKVIGSSSLSLSGETVPLTGGSSKYPWHVEDGAISSELSLTFREYPDFVFELFLGKAPTTVAAETTGNVSSMTAVTGTSLTNATTGIASIAAESGLTAELKFGRYVIKAASATTVDVYVSSDVDFNRGTDEAYESDLLKITASPLTVTDTGGTTSITNFGLEITGGSGTVALTTGDTVTFQVRPINAGGRTVRVGGSADTFPEFGAVVMAKQRGNGELMELDLFRCKAVGAPIGFDENAWSEASVTAAVYYDSAKNGIFDMRFIDT